MDMGRPELCPWSSPARRASADATIAPPPSSSCSFPQRLVHGEYAVTDVSMGNPHAVVFVSDLEAFLRDGRFQAEGPQLSALREVFPEGANAEFAQVS